MDRLLSIDLSTTSTGWAFFLDGISSPVKSGTIETRRKDLAERLDYIGMCIENLIFEYRPDLIVAEEAVYFAQNKAFSLGAVYGILMVLCYRKKIPLEFINNKTWKKHIAGGNSKKEHTFRHIQKFFYSKVETEDEADAIGVGIGYIAEEKFKEKLEKIRR